MDNCCPPHNVCQTLHTSMCFRAISSAIPGGRRYAHPCALAPFAPSLVVKKIGRRVAPEGFTTEECNPLHVVGFLAVFSDIQALAFSFFRYAQTHDDVDQLEQHEGDDRRPH